MIVELFSMLTDWIFLPKLHQRIDTSIIARISSARNHLCGVRNSHVFTDRISSWVFFFFFFFWCQRWLIFLVNFWVVFPSFLSFHSFFWSNQCLFGNLRKYIFVHCVLHYEKTFIACCYFPNAHPPFLSCIPSIIILFSWPHPKLFNLDLEGG